MAEMTREQMLAQIAALTAQNEKLAQAALAKRKVSFKVSEKGALSIYGMGRWPVTLYKSQFDQLFSDETIAQARAFRKANDHLLTAKD